MKSKYAFLSSVRLLVLVLTGVLSLSACSFSSGENDDDVFRRDFEKRKPFLQEVGCLSVFEHELTDAQREALMFLYAYLPLPDVTDYAPEFYLDNIDCSLRAREEMPWGYTVPEREFRHFVLPVRVNNENLDESRMVFYEELKERVRNLSMYDAVLEVNHWCHEKVVYTPSDGRTSAPLATVKTAYGRCGEESTLAVAALRSVGIPARQVYTPRWAHTDDNHAWVEAWADGTWYFLGACEPEPVLNLGWFNAPASRGMFMHTKVFGRYVGPEDVVSRNPCYTEINVTSNYAETAPLVVKTLDRNNRPVSADVTFRVYNYAEFYTVLARRSDADGLVSLSSGLGDIIVMARADGYFGMAKCHVGQTDTLQLCLTLPYDYTGRMEFDIVPPKGHDNLPQLTEEQITANKARLAIEDSIRTAYVSTFISDGNALEVAARPWLDIAQTVRFLKASRGNHPVLREFLEGTTRENGARALSLLRVISEKDLRDVSPEVLEDHFLNTPHWEHEDAFFEQYVLNPRVSNEMLTPYKQFFRAQISEEEALRYRNNPQLIIDWCREHITTDSIYNPQQLCMHPSSVWRTGIADPNSRDIFFVALCRSMGVAARIDEVTGKTQYADSLRVWHDVAFNMETSDAEPQGKVSVLYEQTGRQDDPKYYSHFTFSKMVDGFPVLLNYPEDATWKSLSQNNGLLLDEGNYMTVSGSRMSDGSVLVHVDFFPVKKEGVNETCIRLREGGDHVAVIGSFNSEDTYFDLKTESVRSLLSTTGRGYYVLGLIDPDSEPSNHALRDLAACRKALEQWGQKVVLLFRNKEDAQAFDSGWADMLPSNVVFGVDENGIIDSEIRTSLKLSNGSRPIIIVADTFNRVLHVSQGYTIGIGEQLMDVIHKL